MTKNVPVSVRLPEALNDEMVAMAAALDRPKSWVIEQALRDYISLQQWQLAAIDEGIAEADAGKFIEHDDALTWVRSWGKPDALPKPGCD